MKRISLSVAVALALAVATIAGLWSGGSNKASALPPDFDGFKCYKAQVQVSDRTGEVRYIQDQFVATELILKKPVDYCTLATKLENMGTAGFQTDFHDQTCYGIKDAPNQPRWKTITIDTSDQFNDLTLDLTKPLMLCEPAAKLLGGSSVGAQILNFEFKCYSVRSREGSNDIWHPRITIFDQFYPGGGKYVRLGKPVVFCTQILEKKEPATSDDIEDAESIDAPSEVHASTLTATLARTDPRSKCAPEGYGHSVWYSYAPSADVNFHFDVQQSTFDAFAEIYTGKPGNLEEVTCGNIGDIKLKAFVKYYILVASDGTSPGGKLKLDVDATTKSCASNVCPSGTVIGQPEPRPTNFVCYALGIAGPRNVVIETKDQLTFNKMRIGRQDFYCTPAKKCDFFYLGVQIGCEP